MRRKEQGQQINGVDESSGRRSRPRRQLDFVHRAINSTPFVSEVLVFRGAYGDQC